LVPLRGSFQNVQQTPLRLLYGSSIPLPPGGFWLEQPNRHKLPEMKAQLNKKTAGNAEYICAIRKYVEKDFSTTFSTLVP